MEFWVLFHLGILLALGLDLYVLKKVSAGKACIFWISLALGFNALIGFYEGREAALVFFTAYLLEASLSVDNLFVFLAIFSFFSIERSYVHRVLFWGVIGALVFRLSFILLGLHLLHKFSWMYFVFGAILCLSAFFICRKKKEKGLQGSLVLKGLKKMFRVHPGFHQGCFLVFKEKKIYVTSLFLSLVFVEFSDIIFAIDSIPAVLSITSDPFIAYTSNVFAVLGLRSLYVFLEGISQKQVYLKPAIACILFFVGAKMLLLPVLSISTPVSLGVIIGILIVFIGVIPAIARSEKKQ